MANTFFYNGYNFQCYSVWNPTYHLYSKSSHAIYIWKWTEKKILIIFFFSGNKNLPYVLYFFYLFFPCFYFEGHSYEHLATLYVLVIFFTEIFQTICYWPVYMFRYLHYLRSDNIWKWKKHKSNFFLPGLAFHFEKVWKFNWYPEKNIQYIKK